MLLLLLLLLLLRLTHFLRAYVRTRNLLEMGKEKLERVELLACWVFFFFFFAGLVGGRNGGFLCDAACGQA